MIKINTEIAVTVILTLSVMVAIFTVVGFSKTAKDLEKIDKSMQETQAMVRDANREIHKIQTKKP